MLYVVSVFVLLLGLIAPAQASVQGEKLADGLRPYVSLNAATVAVTHVRVVDGTGAAASPDQTVVFSNGRITAVGSAARVSVPAGATRVDGSGQTLLPGYVGTHNHLFTSVGGITDAGLFWEEWRPMWSSFSYLYLAAGTTTIRTTGTFDVLADLALKRRIDAGVRAGPDIDVTSPYLTGPADTSGQMDPLRDAADARQTVDFWADHGVTSFKVYTEITHAALAAVIDEAHARRLKVMGHLCSIGFDEAIALGIDELEHGPYFADSEFSSRKGPDECPDALDLSASNAQIDPAGPKMSRLITELVGHHIGISSTLAVYETNIPDSPSDAAIAPSLALMSTAQRAYVTASRKGVRDGSYFGPDTLKRYPQFFDVQRTLLKNEMAFELRFARAGGLLTCGPDPTGYGLPLAGYGDWRGIELLVQAGFTPVEAIHIATQNGAVALGRSDSIGTIEVGKRADLIVVQGDPSTKISDIEMPRTVFKDGIGYDSKKIFAHVKGLVGNI